jgi:hypothetical protein
MLLASMVECQERVLAFLLPFGTSSPPLVIEYTRFGVARAVTQFTHRENGPVMR